jgi:hypothetical protein
MESRPILHVGNNTNSARHAAYATSFPALLAGFAVSAAAFIAIYIHLDRGYLWIDEMFSLWATDKAHSVWGMQTQLLVHETNPPLHFWLLYAFRRIIDDPRLAGHALNIVVAATAVSAIVYLPWRAGRPRLGLLLGIVFLMSAGTMSFMQDIRSGLLTMSLCGVAIALAGTIRLKGEADRAELIFAAAVGALAGISHVYGALFTGCLAAAMVIDAALKRNRSQAVFGLVLGAACTLTFAAWFAGLCLSTGGHLGSVAWLARIPPLLGFELVWLSYFGPVWAWYVIGGGFLLALTAAPFRRYAMILLLCAAMIVATILLISLRMPILFFRYFLILGPAFHLLLALAVYDLVQSYWAKSRPSALARLAVLGGCLAIVAPVVTGVFDAALMSSSQDPWWVGIDRVRAEAANCPSHSVRVNLMDRPDLLDGKKWGFTYLLQGTGLQYEDATPNDVSAIDCRIVGWAEHMPQSGAGRLPGAPTEADALKLMNLTNKKHIPLQIERHLFGFVIFKK